MISSEHSTRVANGTKDAALQRQAGLRLGRRGADVRHREEEMTQPRAAAPEEVMQMPNRVPRWAIHCIATVFDGKLFPLSFERHRCMFVHLMFGSQEVPRGRLCDGGVDSFGSHSLRNDEYILHSILG